MGLLDKFKKKNYKQDPTKSNSKKPKLFNFNLAKKISEENVEEIQQQVSLSINKTKTLERLDILENWIVLYSLRIDDNSININALRQQYNKDIKDILDRLDNITHVDKVKADVVLDTTDNQYKNVKKIIIDKAINANTILYNGAYWTIEDILKNYQPPTPPTPEPPAQVDYAHKAGVANEVMFNGKSTSLDNLLLVDYINTEEWKDIINNSVDFDTFKTNMINLLSRK